LQIKETRQQQTKSLWSLKSVDLRHYLKTKKERKKVQKMKIKSENKKTL